jgi:integrase
MRVRLPHIDRFTDRHGRVRYYYRPPRGKRVPLPGLPGTPEFLAAYHAAAASRARPTATASTAAPGTMGRLALDYYASPAFQRLSPTSRKVFAAAIEQLLDRSAIRHAPIAGMQRRHVQALLASRAATPAAAANDLKRLRALIRLALDTGLIDRDPSVGLSATVASDGHHTWTEAEIAQFEARWPIGTMQRAGFALLLYTGQRRGDVVAMTWTMVDAGAITLRQQKTGRAVTVPVIPDLAAALAPIARRCVQVLSTQHGRPFAVAGFGNWVAAAIEAAGLPSACVAHGLRKAAARRLAEAGCSVHEIAAITGHASLAEVQRYTAEADRTAMAHKVAQHLGGTRGERNSQTAPKNSQTRRKTV